MFRNLTPQDILGVLALGAILFGGWNAWIQNKMGSLGRLWGEFNVHVKDYQQNRLADAKEYASRAEVTEAVRHIEADMKSMERRIEDRIDESEKHLGEKIDLILKKQG